MSKRSYNIVAVIWQEGNRYVSKSPELGVASAGNSFKDALENLHEAVDLYLENAKLLGMIADIKPSLESERKFTSTLHVQV